MARPIRVKHAVMPLMPHKRGIKMQKMTSRASTHTETYRYPFSAFIANVTVPIFPILMDYFFTFHALSSHYFPLLYPHIFFSQRCYHAFRRSLCRTTVRGCSPWKALEAVIPLWMASVSSVYSGSSQATPCSSVPGVTWVRVRGWYPYPCTTLTMNWEKSVIRVFHLICFHVDNDKRWKDMVEKNPLYVLAFSGPVYLAVDSFLLLG